MLLSAPNREIVISKVLYLWHVRRHIYCSEIPSNVKLTQVDQEVYKDEM